MVTLWDKRFSWSGEIPMDYPDLNPVAFSRIHQGAGDGQYADELSSRQWHHEADGSAINWGLADGRLGERMMLNRLNPSSEKSRLQLDHFAGLWDTSSGAVLIGGWFWQQFVMSFNPVMDTRATDPFLYLSTNSAGRPRAQVYDAAGSSLHDEYESAMPWLGSTDGYFLGMWVSDEGTSQMFSVSHDGRTYIAPVRTFSGTPNFGSTANLDIFSLRHADYWEAGYADELIVAHPPKNFDLQSFLDGIAGGVWADGQERPGNRTLSNISDSQISANGGNLSFSTGAEQVAWANRPEFSGHTSSYGIYLSDDDGATWQSYSTIGSLPMEFTGLMRWDLSLPDGASFDGIEMTIPLQQVTPQAPAHDTAANTVTISAQEGVDWSHSGTVNVPEAGITITATPTGGYEFPAGAQDSWSFAYTYPDPPTVAPVADVELLQGEAVERYLDWTINGPADWSLSTSSIVTATLTGGTLAIDAGFAIGDTTISVTLTDQYGQSATETIEITVDAQQWDRGAPPRYPHAPIILWDDDDPAEVVIDPLLVIVTKEVNGSHELSLTLPMDHRAAYVIKNERTIEVAGERYRIRRVETARESGLPVMQIYAEAGFYDLATARQIDSREWNQVSAGDVMQVALRNTGWSIGAATVSTLRSYDIEDSNPLELLRTVQDQHGGDLVFDNNARTVSLVPVSGQDKGVSFFYGKGLTESRRVVDTTSLVTRIYAKNAEGRTIASINGGKAYLEDYTYTDELRSATYDFKSGTSPYTMLAMTNATLANRSRPDYSYEVTVEDLSAITHDDLDRFDVGDYVTVVDHSMSIAETQRVMKMEYNVAQPWKSKVTLSATLRELSSSDSTDAGVLTTGATVSTFDLVPYNLLLNARFDNGLAHWAHSGAEIVDHTTGTGDYAVQLAGGGTRWIEQTVQPDNRDAYAFSMDLTTSGGPSGWVPDVVVEAEITYEDGSVETVEIDLE